MAESDIYARLPSLLDYQTWSKRTNLATLTHMSMMYVVYPYTLLEEVDMATASMDKSCRMDIRLSGSQRANYEEAAALRGMTLTQWSTSKLDAAALADIEPARVTRLSVPEFDRFCAMLKEPLPEETRALLAREEIWS